MNDPFYIALFHNSKEKKQTLLLEIDQEIFNMMLAKNMHQIARIEFRNSKFPYARGLCPLATPARGLCPLDPCQGASPLEPPSLINNLGPPFPATGSTPAIFYQIFKSRSSKKKFNCPQFTKVDCHGCDTKKLPDMELENKRWDCLFCPSSMVS